MARKFKIVVPKPASCNEHGTEVKLYQADEIIESEGTWQDDVMEKFIENGWAMEVKVDSVDETVDVQEADVKEVKRARNDKGQLIGDDPETPDVNEAWEGGEAPKKKTTAKKKTTKKKTTKKASS